LLNTLKPPELLDIFKKIPQSDRYDTLIHQITILCKKKKKATSLGLTVRMDGKTKFDQNLWKIPSLWT
jgi:hypothetical protein